MKKPNYNRAIKMARALLAENGVDEPPVLVDELAENLGLILHFEPLPEDVSGFLFVENGTAIIGVHSLHANVRQRFTIAHEIGHHVLKHFGKDMHVDKRFVARSDLSSKAVDSNEIEANWFAAELLMPTDLLRRDIEDVGGFDIVDDDRAIEKLAKRYGVSRQAMTYRLTRETRA